MNSKTFQSLFSLSLSLSLSLFLSLSLMWALEKFTGFELMGGNNVDGFGTGKMTEIGV
jgi:hypothetical protein